MGYLACSPTEVYSQGWGNPGQSHKFSTQEGMLGCPGHVMLLPRSPSMDTENLEVTEKSSVESEDSDIGPSGAWRNYGSLDPRRVTRGLLRGPHLPD